MRTNSIKRFTSAALSVCLMLGAIGFSPIAMASTAPSTTKASYGQYQVKLTADSVTDTPPTNTGGFGTADSAGRIWTDKSVTAGTDGSFGVKLSALAQEYMTSSTTDTSIGTGGDPNAPAADVTFILDMSGSMSKNNDIADPAGTNGYDYRVEAMAKAANDAIRTVMNANSKNKVGVYWFTGSYDSTHVGTLLNMGHYTLNTGHETDDYLVYSGNTGNTTFTITTNSNMKKDGASFTQASKKASGGTPTQDGLRYGISNAISFVKSLPAKGSSDPQRLPYVFLLSDGAATVGQPGLVTTRSQTTSTWNTLPNNPTTDSSYNSLSGVSSSTTGDSNTGSADYAAALILTGMYMKNLLDTAYTTYNNNSPTKTQFYTVGMASDTAINGPYCSGTLNNSGVCSKTTNSVYAWAGLDPKTVFEKRADNTYLKGTADLIGPAVATCTSINTFDTGFCTSSSTGSTSPFVYSDHYVFANTYDLVRGAFSGMASDVEASTTILPLLNIPESSDVGGSEATDMASAIVFDDEIGNGFAVDLSTLKIGNAVAEVDASTNITGGTAYKFAGYGSKAVIKTVSGVTTLTWYINADDMQSHIYRFSNRTSPVAGQYTTPTNGAFTLNYNVKPAFQSSPDNAVNLAYYLNSGSVTGAKTAAYFTPPTDSPYYQNFTTRNVLKTDASPIGATYVTNDSLSSDGKVTMKLGNNGRLDLEMGIIKSGPAAVQISSNFDYTVTVYNYTAEDIEGLTVTSEGQTQTNVTVTAGSSKVLTFHTTAPGTAQTLTSGKAAAGVSGIDFSSNTVDTNVTAAPPNSAPTATGVTITGTANIGSELTGKYTYADSDSDSEDLTPTGTTYQWYSSSDSNSSNKTPITGANSKTYTITSDVAGMYFFFEVTPVAATGIKTGSAVLSAASGPANSAPKATGVTITGTANIGSELTGKYTYADSDSDSEDLTPTGTTYQWYSSSDSNSSNKTAISGANTKTYTITSDMAGKYFFFEVTPVATTGLKTGSAVLSAANGPANSAPTATDVTISGTANVGSELTGLYTYGDTDSDHEDQTPTGTTYQWYSSSDSNSSNKTAISGANTKTYTITSDMAGKYFFFEVTPVATTGLKTGSAVLSAANGPANSAPTATGVTITGTANVGSELTGLYTYGDTDSDHEDQTLTGTTYQWYSSSDSNSSNKTAISGANTKTYTITSDMAGKYFFFEVTPVATTGLKTGSAVLSAASGPANSAPTATDVTISGTANVGSELTGLYTYGDTDSDHEDQTSTGTTYQWYSSSNSDGSNKTAIDGANSKTYTITNGMYGKYLFFEVTPKAQTGVLVGTPARSAATEQVGDTAPVAESVSISGTPTVGQQLTGSFQYQDAEHDAQNTSSVTGTTYQWYYAETSDGSNKQPIANATGTSYTITSDMYGKYLFFEVTPAALTGTLRGLPAIVGTVAPMADTAPTAINLSISNTAMVGHTITGVYTYHDAESDAENTTGSGTAFQWYSGTSSDGSDKAMISGANGISYTITNNEYGKYLFFQVTPVALTGMLTGTPAVIGTIAPVGDTAPVASNLSISGTVKVNQTVTGDYTYSDGDTDAENTSAAGTAFQWYSGLSSSGSDKTPILGATSKTYTVTKAVYGQYLFFQVTPAALTGTLVGAPAIIGTNTPVGDTAPVATNVSISGIPQVNRTLTGEYFYSDAESDIQNATPSGTKFQWYSGASSNGSDKAPIPGATSQTLTVGNAVYGQYVFFEVTPVALTGTLTGLPVVSSSYGPVLPVAPSGTLILALDSTTTNSATLIWNTVTGATYYNVYENSELIATHVTNSSESGVTYTVLGLQNDVTYHFTVSAANSGGETTQSNTVDVMIPSANAAVHGTIYSSTGGTIAGLTVQLLDLSGSEVIATTLTDSTGMYAFDHQLPGVYIVSARIPSTELARASVQLVNWSTVQQDLTLPGNAKLNLNVNPAEIVGDGKSTSTLQVSLTLTDGTPITDAPVQFATTAGTLSTQLQNTDNSGIASSVLTAPLIHSIVPIVETTKVLVRDFNKGIFAEGEVNITFEPATVKGIVTKGGTNIPVPGATVRITLDLNGDGIIEPGVDFDKTVVTDANGAYSTPVPEGQKTYNIQVTEMVTVGGVDVPFTYNQSANVGQIIGAGDESFESEKTATGIVLLKNPDGNTSLLSNDVMSSIKLYLKDANGNYVTDNNGNPKPIVLQGQGLFSAEGLTIGNYSLEIKYTFAPGVEIIIGQSNVNVTANGEMNISEDLIDPYGVIKDASTNALIDHAQVTLYYADTKQNRDSGKTPNTGVVLPPVVGFQPNDNASPIQYSDVHGLYAYMVFPNTDYYLVITKAGYQTYTSPTISVGTSIVKYDVDLIPLSNVGASTSSSSSIAAPSNQPSLALNLSVDKNTAEEGSQSVITVDYKNQGTATLDSGKITVTVPAGVVIVDAGGGTVNGNTITWSVSKLAGGQSGSNKIKVQWPQLNAQQAVYDVSGEFALNTGSVDASTAKAQSAVKIQIYSNRYDTLKHQRYILGYPDGLFKPNNMLTRAELAAIVARLTDNSTISDPIKYTDVTENHWAANYIKIVTKYGFFTGFEDGSFHPEAPVTRGELASVMTKFLKLDTSSPITYHFTDVANSWAAPAIEALYRGSFVAGYPDGTFKPQNSIIRSEAVTLINRMLYRGPLTGLAPSFPDVPQTHWAFGDVQEATVSHESIHDSNGSEIWKKTVSDDVK